MPQAFVEIYIFFFSNIDYFRFCEKGQLAVHQTDFLFFSGTQRGYVSQNRPCD